MVAQMQLFGSVILSLAVSAALPQASPLPRVGDYLEVDALARVRMTRTVWEAGPDQLARAISVQRDGRGRRIVLIEGGQSGRILFAVGRDGRLRRALAWGAGPGLALRLAGAGEICLGGPRTVRCYRHVGDAGRYLDALVLAGTYRDRQGQIYRFGADGQAQFPGYAFHYALVLHPGQMRCDAFQAGTEDHVIAFRRYGPVLALFATTPAASGFKADFRRPLAVLTAQH